MLEAYGLVKRFGSVGALRGFSLSVQRGEIVGLVGHNGAGKSTFVELVAGLLQPDSGTLQVDGRAPRAARPAIGIMPQSIALYPGMTVREHLRLFGGLAGLRGRQLAASIDELVVALQLAEFVDRRLGLLSGGQQRRTQAATALLHRPGLLVLDEPTAGADPQTRQSLLAVVRDRARQGAAVVYVTHYLPELTELGATLAVARHGRVIARGAAAELLRGLPSVVTVASDRAERSVPTHDPTATLIDLLGREGGTVVSIEVRNPSLDDLYASLAVGAHD